MFVLAIISLGLAVGMVWAVISTWSTAKTRAPRSKADLLRNSFPGHKQGTSGRPIRDYWRGCKAVKRVRQKGSGWLRLTCQTPSNLGLQGGRSVVFFGLGTLL